MAAKKKVITPDWVNNRIVGFFNRVKNADEITNGVSDDPSCGGGYGIGNLLAVKILKQRNTLPARRFRTIDQLMEIKGLGKDKLKDLVHSLGTSAAEFFKTGLYENGIIYKENWPVEYFSFPIKDKKTFQTIANNDGELRAFVSSSISKISRSKRVKSAAHEAMVEQVESAYIDSYQNGTEEALIAMALWFYRFDADNWFSFDQMLMATRGYFDYHSVPVWEMNLKFFKGFEHRILNGSTPKDLPVVVNHPEKTITIWTAALND